MLLLLSTYRLLRSPWRRGRVKTRTKEPAGNRGQSSFFLVFPDVSRLARRRIYEPLRDHVPTFSNRRLESPVKSRTVAILFGKVDPRDPFLPSRCFSLLPPSGQREERFTSEVTSRVIETYVTRSSTLIKSNNLNDLLSVFFVGGRTGSPRAREKEREIAFLGLKRDPLSGK